MDKVARKPSTDPVQEKLRLNKAQWNKEVSTFINDLINFKKTMNGWPSKFHMERSSIKEPIPADPATIIGSLAGDFQELAQKGNELIGQQLDYSKARKKTQPKGPAAPTNAPATPTAPPTGPDLSQQLAAHLEQQYQLTAEGSNPLTRFFSTLKGPWFGAESRNRKYRVTMLKAATDLNKDLKRFEAQIMGSSPDSIFSAGKMLSKIENQIFYLQDSLASQKNPINLAPSKDKKPGAEVPDEAKPIPGQESVSLAPQSPAAANIPQISSDDPVLVAVKSSLADFRKSKPNFTDLNPALERALAGLMLKFYNSPTNEEKIRLAPALMNAYQSLLADSNMRHGTQAPTLAEVLQPKIASAQLEVVAQNLLTKWLGQIKHNLSPFDKTSALRLDLLKLSKESRKVVNSMMDALEKDVDPKLLGDYLDFIDKNLVAMKQAMKPLENTIRGNMFDKTFLNLLKNKKITEHSLNLDPKQQAHFEKMLQNRQYRDLTNMYSKR